MKLLQQFRQNRHQPGIAPEEEQRRFILFQEVGHYGCIGKPGGS